MRRRSKDPTKSGNSTGDCQLSIGGTALFMVEDLLNHGTVQAHYALRYSGSWLSALRRGYLGSGGCCWWGDGHEAQERKECEGNIEGFSERIEVVDSIIENNSQFTCCM